MNMLNILQSKRTEILALAAKHGASNVRLFGSVLRGEDREDSDVDFLVDMQERKPSSKTVEPKTPLSATSKLSASPSRTWEPTA